MLWLSQTEDQPLVSKLMPSISLLCLLKQLICHLYGYRRLAKISEPCWILRGGSVDRCVGSQISEKPFYYGIAYKLQIKAV